MTHDKPAILGGTPAFEKLVPITQPTLPKLDEIKDETAEIFSTCMLTNSKYVALFEKELCSYLGVKHAVAVSSCTTGMMLTLKSLGLKGEVILPSFTFSATGHAVMWSGLKPVLVDINPETYLIDENLAEKAITPKTCAILAVHIFGNPCNVDALQEVASRKKLKLIFDAAHAFGSLLNGKHVGTFGNAEVFSASPTKLMVAGEGGIVATNDGELRRKVAIGRNYGDDGSYDCEFAGINARMTEFNAILGLKTLERVEENIVRRIKLVERYKARLDKLSGIGFQKITPNSRSTFKDLSIFVDRERFGMSRDILCKALEKENIATKKYFFPPLHRQRAYSHLFRKYKDKLPVTNHVSENVLSMPLYSHMSGEYVDRICSAVERVYEWRGEIA